MIGLTLGGVIWGIMGDKKGRLSVLFGSIILYSLANIANGMVQTVPQYILLRFIAGIGLAGELGASITLVAEMLPKEKRGLAASVIAVVGVFGAIAAFFVYQTFQDWRLCYYIGGVMGLLLLLLRANVMESSMYDQVKDSGVVRGSFIMLFNKKERALRYLKGVLIGLPVWYAIGVLVTFSDKFGKEFGIEGVEPGKAIMYQYVGIALGDLSAGLFSNYLKSRKKSAVYFLWYPQPVHHCILFAGRWMGIRSIHVPDLQLSGFWCGLLRVVYYHVGRTVRHQSPRFYGYLYSHVLCVDT
eukprot:Opistho-2@28431